MLKGTIDRIAFDRAAHALLRMLIASYFLAASLQIIPGTDLSVLFASVLPAPYDAATVAGIVFILGFMIMLGHATRLAALILALMTFYASYLAMVSLGVADELGSFWRDLALIAALLLTYGETGPGQNRRRRMFQRKILPRRASFGSGLLSIESKSTAQITPQDLAAAASAARRAVKAHAAGRTTKTQRPRAATKPTAA